MPIKNDNPILVYIIRHAESHSNGTNRIQGHSDSGLTERGLRQARKIARRLKSAGIRRLYASDLGRARNTAAAIGKAIGKRVNPDHGIREIQLGKWEGLTPEEVNAHYDGGYDDWLKSPSRKVIPSAERMEKFHQRVRGRVKQMIACQKKGPIAIVTHGGVIASLISGWLEADFDKTLLCLRVDNTSVTLVEKTAHRLKIHLLNDTSHLSAGDLSCKNIFTNRA